MISAVYFYTHNVQVPLQDFEVISELDARVHRFYDNEDSVLNHRIYIYTHRV